MTTPSFLLMSFVEKFFNSLDRIVKNEDVPLKGQLGYGWVHILRWLASNGSSNL